MNGSPLPSRFGMTPPPRPGGKLGDYEEKLAQWFLEDTFFLDFVYRNPTGKGGKGELADAAVLFGDVALLVQVKAQFSARPPVDWAKKAIRKALGQLKGTHRMLFKGHVRTLISATFGVVPFDPARYPNRIGLIILAHDAEPYDPEGLEPDLAAAAFRTHVFSLTDFIRLTNLFDTAADLISYLDFRDDLKAVLPRRVHDEPATLTRIASRVGEVLRRHRPSVAPDILERSVRAIRKQAFGQLITSPDWKYGLAIDDIIARLHERDPSLPWNQGTNNLEVMRVVEQLAWLSRDRRIALGKRLVGMGDRARDGEDHYFSHYQRPIGVCFVFLVTSAMRRDRTQFLRFLVGAAMVKFGAHTGVGVATEPIGPGRSYDVLMLKGDLHPDFRQKILEMGDPFKGALKQWIP